MKRSVLRHIAILIISLSIINLLPVFAEGDEDYQIEMLLQDANDYITSTYGIEDYYPDYVVVQGKRHYVNLDIYAKYRVITYFSDLSLSSINKAKDIVEYSGETIYRYIGYTSTGEKYYNSMFPADTFYNSYSSYVLDTVNDDVLSKMPDNIKDGFMSNFLKSASEDIYAAIERHYTMRASLYDKDKIDELIAARKKDWDLFFSSVDRDYWAGKIKIESLPSPVSKGVVLLTHGKYYYTIDLNYEENAYGTLSVKHIPVSKSLTGYIRSYTNASMSDHDYTLSLEDGDTLDISADEVKGFRVVGYAFFDGYHNEYHDLEAGEDIGLFVIANSYIYKYLYNPNTLSPVLVFYYEKEEEENLLSTNGEVVISSDVYDVARAIPSSEPVTVEARNIRKYISNFDISTIRKQLSVEVDFVKNGTSQTSLKKNLYYEYAVLDSYYLFYLQSVLVKNNKLSTGLVSLNNSEPIDYRIIKHGEHQKIDFNYSGTYDVDFVVDGDRVKIDVSIPDDTVYISLEDRQKILADLLHAIKIKVRNDLVYLDGDFILSDEFQESKTLGKTSPNEKYITLSAGSKIDDRAKNGLGTTSAKLVYQYISGNRPDISATVTGNSVLVHTPVYNNTTIDFDPDVDQRAYDKKIPAMVLDRIYKISLSSEGKHIEEKGYSFRDYNKYVQKKFIILPFDAFVASDRALLEQQQPEARLFRPKNSKIAVNVGLKEIYVKPAPWAVEGQYNIRSIYVAINSGGDVSIADTANFDRAYNSAEKSFDVDLCGKLFAFTVTSIEDPRFKDESYVVNKHLASIGGNKVFSLPIKAPNGKENLFSSVKLGYPIEFTVRSCGTYRNKDDVVVAEPKFIYVDTGGVVHENIALFTYEKGEYIPFQSNNAVYYDKKSVISALSDTPERHKTMLAYSDLYPLYSDISDIVYKIISAREVFRFSPALSISTPAFRLFSGDVSRDYPVAESLQYSGVQDWNFIHGLPNNTVVFLKDEAGKIDYRSKLETGFIGVYFDLYLSIDKNKHGARLKYKTDSQNQWKIEGYRYDKPLDKEIVVYYNLSKKASDDISLY